jgi:hypothetical protein
MSDHDAQTGSEQTLRLNAPALEILDDRGQPIAAGGWSCVVGEKVSLSVRAKAAGPIQLTDIEWKIQNFDSCYTVYEQWTSFSKQQELTKEAVKKETLGFYFTAPVESGEIAVTATAAGAKASARVKLTVLAPTDVKVEATIDPHILSHGLGVGYSPGVGEGIGLFVAQDRVRPAALGDFGITWKGTATAPAQDGAGRFGFVQIYNQDVKATTPDDLKWAVTSKGKYLLDYSQQIRAREKLNGVISDWPRYGPVEKAGAGEPVPDVRGGDGPLVPFQVTPHYESVHEMTIDNGVKTYFMYQPEKTDAIWVSLYVIEWSFGGTAEADGSADKGVYKEWRYRLKPGTSHAKVSVRETRELPTWKDNVESLDDQWEIQKT